MGSRMAANLLKNGMDITVYNRSKQPVDELGSAGAKAGETPQATVADADYVFTMLASPEAVQEIALGNDGFLPAMKAGALWVDCTTVDPAFSLACNEAANAKGVRFMDVPLTGTKPQAARAELVFFAGGSNEDLAEVEPLLMYMGQRILHIGETGKGSSFKILSNTMLAQAMIAFSETLLLGEKMGLSRDFLLEALPNLPVAAPFLKNKIEMIRSEQYDTQFPLELMQKDLHLFTLTAYHHNHPAFMANLAKEIFADAKKRGFGREDFSAIYSFLKG